MKILGIESSCDDTSAALVECSDEGFFVLAEKTASQIEVHKKYGGVVPEIAGRQHAENILPVIESVLSEGVTNVSLSGEKPEIDAIAVTSGPGLITGLIVGVETAKALSYLWDIPLVSANHIAGHALSVLIESKDVSIEFPAITLIVSGGHTELLLMKSPTDFELIGKTRDDAAGEAFDKVGKLLGFEYPGGPKISKEAESGNPNSIKLPRPMLDEDNFDFSFAGLKTAALYYLRDNPDVNKADFCASFEEAVIDTLVKKTARAAEKHEPKSILLGGGVSANKKLRERLQEEFGNKLMIPNLKYSMDNAAMIAVAGYFKAKSKEFTDWKNIEANPNWRVYDK